MSNSFNDILLVVPRLLQLVNSSLAVYLEEILPVISNNWWDDCVVAHLSTHQIQRIEYKNINTLSGLDLAALLKIFDQNWYEISKENRLSFEERHFVKEMQTIRNRWAHINSDPISSDIIYRDLDTIQRFTEIIECCDSVLPEIKHFKKELVLKDYELTDPLIDKKIEIKTQESQVIDEFSVGREVFIISNPTIKGVITEVIKGIPENRYKVFISNGIQTLYASQIGIEKKEAKILNILKCNDFHSYLTSFQIKYPGISNLYSLNSAKIDFIPYQFRPVLKFIKSDRPRMLIADSVGVGKTIEAGLILRELQARREVESILIICPKQLVTEGKWLREMKRFDEDFEHLDGKKLHHCISEMDLDGVWPDKHKKIIVPYSLFDDSLLGNYKQSGSRKKKIHLLSLDPPPRFDLVIVDEAHNIRNSSSIRHQVTRFFCDNAEAVIFLTATPVQMGSLDLFVLLNTLRPDLIIDKNSFSYMSEPNQFINEAVSCLRLQLDDFSEKAHTALENAANTSWGQSLYKNNPDFINVCNMLKSGSITDEERISLIRKIEEMHTFSNIINRTRRRDIGDFTIRKPYTVSVPFTEQQQLLHDNLLKTQAEVLKLIHNEINIKFLMTTLCRQASSCIFGLAPLIKEIITRHLDELVLDELDFANEDFVLNDDDYMPLKDKINSLIALSEALDYDDPKFEALLKIIEEKQKLPNNKIILFSSFRHTLSYLYKKLNQTYRIGLIHGSVPDDDRVVIRNRFSLKKEDTNALDILLFSDVGCEGLDYQMCDCLINYDLPWNPMRIEQRIGRIDRNGQKSESVAIYNMITPGTIDAEVYERCLLRIGIFENALGGGEEILGEITQEIKNIAENFVLDVEDIQEKLQQLADNKIRLIKEQEDLEERQIELFGINLPQKQFYDDIEDASSFWLSGSAILRLVQSYFNKRFGESHELFLGEKNLKTLRLNYDFRQLLLEDYKKLPKSNNRLNREWEKWLKGNNQHLQITFDSETSQLNPEAVFLTPLHPLVKQAANNFDNSDTIYTFLTTYSDDVPVGRYEFIIYHWKYKGIRDDQTFKVIINIGLSEKEILLLFEYAFDTPANSIPDLEEDKFESLETTHYSLWNEKREEHKSYTRKIAEYRKESLEMSHKARINLLEEQLNSASEEKIRKMRNSQISSANHDFKRHIEDLNHAINQADLMAEPLIKGVLEVRG